MASATRFLLASFVSLLVLEGCGSPRVARPPTGPVTLMDFLQTYNAYATGQLYLKRGQHEEALVEYKQSLHQFTRLDNAARTVLRDEYGLTQEQVERELAIASALAQQEATAKGDNAALEKFREQVLAGFYPYGRGTPTVSDIHSGTQIAQGDWQMAQDLLPREILAAVVSGHFAISLQATTDLPPSDEYVVATMGGNNVQLSANGELIAYAAGRPFPTLEANDAQAGLKAGWNLRYAMPETVWSSGAIRRCSIVKTASSMASRRIMHVPVECIALSSKTTFRSGNKVGSSVKSFPIFLRFLPQRKPLTLSAEPILENQLSLYAIAMRTIIDR